MHAIRFVRSVAAALLAGGVAWFGVGAAPGVASASSQQGNGRASSGQGVDRSLDFWATPRMSRCAVRDPLASEQIVIEEEANRGSRDDGSIKIVPVYWHIITTTTGGGNVSGRVAEQMQVLNTAFAGSRFMFELEDMQVVANSTWFFAEIGSAEEVAMKAALRRGGPDALNIYTTNGDVYLGWATLPFYYKFFPSYDGVVLWWAALPGTGLAGSSELEPDGVLTYDQGDTGTHEVGHWLGLSHTFAGGCSNPGDSIKDTPAEAEPQFFCAPRDSCTGPRFRGTDPIMNFMNYVDDVCMDHFTADQSKRMGKHWHAFRDKKSRP